MKTIALCLIAAGLSSSAPAQTIPPSASASEQALPLREIPRKQSPEDKTLTSAVRHKLGQAHGLDATSISVRSHAGIVWLVGSVTNAEDINRAGELAQTVPGVQSVVNKLTLRARM